ncbi:S-adenosyl-L-methionine-dependent methyltransferase [Achaetomium macrosporum]|uniref:S-adenosyl-L-methionine-dependent methyltransferase n=1 Tax=Achaetomium macrosporum TaxID=79813 RepID=A0AAN7C580_9PEZI|nr:S-adenosyl-L-methionine-dependent methyltransferase [Achaetomium macrosporum]
MLSTTQEYNWTRSLETLKDSIRIQLDEQQVKFEGAMVRSAYHFITDAAQELKGDDQEDWEWHHQVMYNWMLKIVSLGNSGDIAPGSETWEADGVQVRQSLGEYLESTGDASAQLMVRVGQNIVKVFRGELTPLELVMEDNLLNRYYMEYPKLKERTYKHLSKVAESYARVRPDAHILEIGAGTGGATKVVLQAFDAALRDPEDDGGDDADRRLHYTFTDVSAGFFPAANTKLAGWVPNMDFKKLNVEDDPEAQGFEPGMHDLVVASLVLHATKSLEHTLAHVRKLLKPGGRLLLVETTRDVVDMQLIFGLFPGWWLGADKDRIMSPKAPTAVWDQVMREVGFAGVEFEIGDCEEAEYQSTSLLVTSALPVS